MEWELGPRTGGTPVHVHPRATETYEVVEGTLDIFVDGGWRSLSRGERITIEAGVPHTFRNSSSSITRVANSHQPALRYAQYFEGLYRITSRGIISSQKMTLKAILHLAVLMTTFRDEIVSVRPPDMMMRIFGRLGRLLGYQLAILLVVACASAPGGASSSQPADPALPPAPWSGASIRATDVPPIYMTVWRSAANRERCALLGPAQLPAEFSNATPRAATFSGGWAVAYDTPQQRSAFGIAGSGSSAWSPGIYDQWPHRITWADSSRAEYGLEGGTGPNWLAYLRIPGQDCLYNIWSREGRQHLERLLTSLRFVAR